MFLTDYVHLKTNIYNNKISVKLEIIKLCEHCKIKNIIFFNTTMLFFLFWWVITINQFMEIFPVSKLNLIVVSKLDIVIFN